MMLQNLISTETRLSDMKLEKINLGETGNFSPIFLDYISKSEPIRPFYNLFPEKENFKLQIDLKSGFSGEKRVVLYNVLQKQYNQLQISEAVSKSIDLIQENNTFTITTGHQLNIFTGPLYFIYKIATTINACKQLKTLYPEYNFIPVYWMASEDHDFDEISSFNLFGQKYKWETDQKGAVGRFNPSSLKELLDRIPEKPEVFEKAYLTQKTLADSVRYYVNWLFGEEGLLVLDPDNQELKSLFKSVIKDDLINNTAGLTTEETSRKLDKAGYKTQIHPREINFFYLESNLRERIVKEGKQYKVLNSTIEFSEKEILDQIESHPERFSPNVVLRPLYQEVILPNLAYIGGPAEIAYWLQLKGVFDYYNEVVPFLMPRNFALFINKTNAKKFRKLNISIEDLFQEIHELKSTFIRKNSNINIEFQPEFEVLEQIFESIKYKAKAVDASLEGWVAAEGAKVIKAIEAIEKRLKKAEEKNQETGLAQLENIKEKLFPGGSLQERVDNFLNYYINNPEIIQYFIYNLDSFDFRFNVIIEENT
jgi:bacillithiol synthase